MTRARLGALAVVGLLVGLAATSSSAESPPPVDRAILVVIQGISFDEALAVPEIASIARAGGLGLLVNASRIDPQSALPRARRPGQSERIFLQPSGPSLGSDIRAAIGIAPGDRVLVIVAGNVVSTNDPTIDDLALVVMAYGIAGELLPAEGPFGSLTSDSTRRDGVVVGEDVAATFRAYFGDTDPGVGSRIRVVDGPPPFELHERYLAQRRMYIPIGAAATVYVIGFGLVAAAFVAAGSRISVRWRRVAGWIAFSVAMLATSLLAAGHLPELSYATVVPFIALVTVFGTLAFAPLERRDVLLVPAGIGVTVLAYFVLEAALGWTAMLTPFVGGSQLDGGRFYGLPNVGIGLLVGACLWVAQQLRTSAGFGLLVGAALFAGMPFLGANLGGAVTLFAGAGLWVAVRERERLGMWKGIAVFLGTMVLGTAAILLAHAISPIETHVTRFEEQASGLGGVLEKFVDRLQVGFDLIARNPLALIPVLGLPVAIAVVLRPPAALWSSLEHNPAWRDAILVTLLTGIVAYVVNDSGPAAAGFAFGLGLGGLLGVSLLLRPAKMEDR